MKGANISKDEFRTIKETLLQELEKIKKFENSDAIFKNINKIINIAKEIGLSVLQRFAFHFYSYYNHLIQKFNHYKKFVELSKFMLQNLFQENFRDLIRSEMLTIFFGWNLFEDINEPDNMDDYEVCFLLCILTKNINLMKLFFNEYLNIDIFEKEEFNSLDFENPYTIVLFKNLFNKIFFENIKKRQKNNKDIQTKIIESINESNHSNYNLFRCENCFSIKHIKQLNNNNISLRCMFCNDNYSDFKQVDLLNKISDINFFCSNCKEQLFLYKTNFKCIFCKKLICMNCKVNHIKNCFSFDYIKLYEVGYKCEIHCKNYIGYCFKCKQNLCKSCKNIHCHKIYETNNIKHYLKNVKFDENDLIIQTLITIYKENNISYLFNGYIFEILCSLKNIDISDIQNNIFFQTFNNKAFRKYYKFALKKISEGSSFYLNRMFEINKNYNNENKKINKLDYNPFIISERDSYINKFIKRTKFYFLLYT